MSEMIKAKNYISNNTMLSQSLSDTPRLHFTPPVGWLNDPNGLVFFRGKYHLFYQYYPFDTNWGQMHWGHAVSTDMIRWHNLPVALAPTEKYESSLKGGCFSGTAIVENNRLFLFYTGVSEGENGQLHQVQCGAWSDDGINFTKFVDNPLIIHDNLGEFNEHFRDPKVWKNKNSFYMLIGVSQKGKGRLLLYQSEDMFNWNFLGNPLSGEYGWMIECPDFFHIGERDIITFSPVGVKGSYSVYLVGNMNYELGKFEVLKEGKLDVGVDFYAAQSLLDEQNNRYLIAWQNGWEWMDEWNGFGSTKKNKWIGSMSLPRKVTLSKDQLNYRFPDVLEKSLETYWELEEGENIKLTDLWELPDPCVVDITLDSQNCCLKLCTDGGRVDSFEISQAAVIYNGIVGLQQRKQLCMQLEKKKTISLRIVIDLFSIEIFQEGTDRALSINCFEDGRSKKILSFERLGSVEKFSIKNVDFEKLMGDV